MRDDVEERAASFLASLTDEDLLRITGGRSPLRITMMLARLAREEILSRGGA